MTPEERARLRELAERAWDPSLTVLPIPASAVLALLDECDEIYDALVYERDRRDQAEREREQMKWEADGVHTALAEANVPRAAGVDEPLWSEAHRVRLLRERAEQAEAERDQAQNEAAEMAAELGILD